MAIVVHQNARMTPGSRGGFIILLLLMLLLISSLPLSAQQNQSASHAVAGWAEADITPPLGIGLGGRGGPETTATKVLDPLYAQILVLKDAKGTGMAIVSMDLIGISHEFSERVRTALGRELGVEYNLIVLNCSHTHSGPYMIRDLIAGVGPAPQIEIDYFNSLKDKLVVTARAASRSMAPVTVQVFQGKSRVAINRRNKNKEGVYSMLPDADGPIAEQLWILKLTPSDARLPIVLFSYACHPVIVYGYANSAISADFPGATRKLLGEKLSGTHVQFIQGTAGNVRPRVTADLANGRFRPTKPEDTIQVANDLSADVLTALDGKGSTLELDLAGSMDHPFLPRDKPPPRQMYEDMARSPSKFLQSVSKYWLARYDSGEGFAKGDSWTIGLIRLADNQWIVYSAGEPCVEWGPKVSAWLAPKNVVMWGYCQEAISYLPTENLLPQGGYEVDESNRARASTPARFAPGIEDAVRRSLLRQSAAISTSVK